MANLHTVPQDLPPIAPEPAPIQIGATIRGYRLQRGMSQGDIEKRTGLLRCYLSRVENGHTVPSLETLQKIAGAHGPAAGAVLRRGGESRRCLGHAP
jgi:transcriptional regulator with XRE-family HTH domain